VIDAGKTIFNPNSSLIDKGIAIFDIVSPVSSKELKAGKKLLDGVGDAKKAKSGVYVLKDADDKVVRTGRTKDLDKRKKQHENDKNTKGLNFDDVHRTDNYSEQRGLEQVIYNANPQAKSANGGLNKIKPISDKNTNKTTYENAAKDYLKNKGGG